MSDDLLYFLFTVTVTQLSELQMSIASDGSRKVQHMVYLEDSALAE